MMELLSLNGGDLLGASSAEKQLDLKTCCQGADWQDRVI